jgi:hypothetical protein
VHAHAIAYMEVLVHGKCLDGRKHEHGSRKPKSIVERPRFILSALREPSHLQATHMDLDLGKRRRILVQTRLCG